MTFCALLDGLRRSIRRGAASRRPLIVAQTCPSNRDPLQGMILRRPFFSCCSIPFAISIPGSTRHLVRVRLRPSGLCWIGARRISSWRWIRRHRPFGAPSRWNFAGRRNGAASVEAGAVPPFERPPQADCLASTLSSGRAPCSVRSCLESPSPPRVLPTRLRFHQSAIGSTGQNIRRDVCPLRLQLALRFAQPAVFPCSTDCTNARVS